MVVPNRFGYIHHNRRYLAAARGGTPASVLLLLAFLLAHLCLLFASVWLLARPVGWLAGSEAVQPGLRGCGAAEDCQVGAPLRLLLPGAVLVALAAVPLTRSLFVWGERRKSLVRTGLLLGAAGVSLLVLLVAVPWAMDTVPTLLAEFWTQLPATDPQKPAADANHAARLLQVLSALGLVAALTRLLTNRLAKAAPRLGGVLLGLLIVLLGGQLATDAARLGPGRPPGLFGRQETDLWCWGVLLAGFALAYVVLNQRWWSPHTIYKRRLRITFATTTRADLRQWGWADNACFRVYPLRSRVETDQRTWDRYPEHQPAGGDGDSPGSGPELVICAAVQRSSRDITGVPALSFVFSRSRVGFYEPGPGGKAWLVEPERYVEALPGIGWFANSQATVSNAIALTGAAFTSAMGRQSVGTTNALLAALNLRLGVWLPNPQRIPVAGGRRFGVPRLSWLLREVFGRYQLDAPYVYVSDGGHWENLGLVELIRRRCRVVVCVDASGDPYGTLATLREAIDLAWQDCRARINIDLTGLDPRPFSDGTPAKLPATNVATGQITYADDSCGWLLFGKLMVAADSTPELRSYASLDKLFPRYSTADQFLSEAEFRHLVLLGEEVGERLADKWPQSRGGEDVAP